MQRYHRKMEVRDKNTEDALTVTFLLKHTKMDARQTLSIFLNFLHTFSRTTNSKAEPQEYQCLGVTGNHTK